MEKLFDLMLMGFKYQVLCSQHAQDLLQVPTVLHLAITFFTLTWILTGRSAINTNQH